MAVEKAVIFFLTLHKGVISRSTSVQQSATPIQHNEPSEKHSKWPLAGDESSDEKADAHESKTHLEVIKRLR